MRKDSLSKKFTNTSKQGKNIDRVVNVDTPIDYAINDFSSLQLIENVNI